MGKTVKTALAVLCLALLLSACGEKPAPAAYTQISAQEAYEMMDGEAVILDVREREEYDAGHIPGAVLLPVGTVSGDSAAAVIAEDGTPSKTHTIGSYSMKNDTSHRLSCKRKVGT